MNDARRMTRAEILELHQRQAMTNVDDLARAMGTGKNVIYEMIQRGEWTATRVLRVGRHIKIPTADIVKAVGLSVDDPTAA